MIPKTEEDASPGSGSAVTTTILPSGCSAAFMAPEGWMLVVTLPPAPNVESSAPGAALAAVVEEPSAGDERVSGSWPPHAAAKTKQRTSEVGAARGRVMAAKLGSAPRERNGSPGRALGPASA